MKPIFRTVDEWYSAELYKCIKGEYPIETLIKSGKQKVLNE